MFPAPYLEVSVLGLGIVIMAGAVVLADAYYQSYKIYKEVKGVQPDLATARNYLSRGQQVLAR